MEPVKILVVEDEFVTGLEIQDRIRNMGYEVPKVIGTGEEAVRWVSEFRPNIVIMDITLQGAMTGIEAAEKIREQYNIPVIFLTAHSDDATVERAVTAEPFGYLIKPLEERSLKTAIRMALYKHSLDKALRESENRYRAIAELAEDPIFIINKDFTVAFLNRFAFDFFHTTVENAVLSDMRQVFPPGLADPLFEQIKTVIDYGHPLRITHYYTEDTEEKWLDITVVPVYSEEDVIQVIALAHDITAMVKIEKEIEKKGLIQIEHNMEQFQILNDHIRNPLSIIMSLASLIETKEADEIINEVERIDDLVRQLDQGWIQSEAVRAFLLKHYGHGKISDL